MKKRKEILFSYYNTLNAVFIVECINYLNFLFILSVMYVYIYLSK